MVWRILFSYQSYQKYWWVEVVESSPKLETSVKKSDGTVQPKQRSSLHLCGQGTGHLSTCTAKTQVIWPPVRPRHRSFVHLCGQGASLLLNYAHVLSPYKDLQQPAVWKEICLILLAKFYTTFSSFTSSIRKQMLVNFLHGIHYYLRSERVKIPTKMS